ncbi:MAG: FAD binding domain-containing protein [Candidatus Bathyarchaeia archaeon]
MHLHHMRPFEYFQPTELKSTLQLLKEHRGKAEILAGGTDQVVLLKAWKSQPPVIIDIGNLQELDFITEDASFIRIGPLTTHATLSKSPLMQQKCIALAEAADKAGPVQIKNLGTVGGNIVSAGRCADTVPPLLCLDATLKLMNAEGERTVALSEFSPKARSTVLGNDELLTEIKIPQPPPNTASAFLKLGRRIGHDFSIANAAAMITLENHVCKAARIAVGASVTAPERIMKAEDALLGRELTSDNIEKAAALAAGEISPISDFRASSEYRREVSKVLVRRVLEAVRIRLGG